MFSYDKYSDSSRSLDFSFFSTIFIYLILIASVLFYGFSMDYKRSMDQFYNENMIDCHKNVSTFSVSTHFSPIYPNSLQKFSVYYIARRKGSKDELSKKVSIPLFYNRSVDFWRDMKFVTTKEAVQQTSAFEFAEYSTVSNRITIFSEFISGADELDLNVVIDGKCDTLQSMIITTNMINMKEKTFFESIDKIVMFAAIMLMVYHSIYYIDFFDLLMHIVLDVALFFAVNPFKYISDVLDEITLNVIGYFMYDAMFKICIFIRLYQNMFSDSMMCPIILLVLAFTNSVANLFCSLADSHLYCVRLSQDFHVYYILEILIEIINTIITVIPVSRLQCAFFKKPSYFVDLIFLVLNQVVALLSKTVYAANPKELSYYAGFIYFISSVFTGILFNFYTSFEVISNLSKNDVITKRLEFKEKKMNRSTESKEDLENLINSMSYSEYEYDT